MTAKDFNILLIELGLTPGKLGRLFGVSGRTARNWKKFGLDESAGGAQAAVASALRLLRGMADQEAVIYAINEALAEGKTHATPIIERPRKIV